MLHAFCAIFCCLECVACAAGPHYNSDMLIMHVHHRAVAFTLSLTSNNRYRLFVTDLATFSKPKVSARRRCAGSMRHRHRDHVTDWWFLSSSLARPRSSRKGLACLCTTVSCAHTSWHLDTLTFTFTSPAPT